MFNPDLEVSVNYEFTQMLKALEAKELFGKDEDMCLSAFAQIGIELGNRQFVLGMSSGASVAAPGEGKE